jgi:type I restriction enzyme M protein
MQIEKGVDKIVKTIRLMILDQPGYLGRVATAVGNAGGNITDLHLVSYGVEYNTRDLTLFIDDEAQLQEVLAEIGKVQGVIISEIIDPVLEMHRGGKIRVKSRVPLDGLSTLRKIYTPGVAKVCKLIEQTPDLKYEYTSIGNTVAIVTNGTAILGLGDIGPVAGMPVMEGKAVLFDALAGINGVPILLASKDTEEIIHTVAMIAPTFGAIKLEDIKAPECFEIESRLDAMLDIPVMHDDQHGTATVALAALLNATKYVGKPFRNDCVGIVGLGAAGMGIAKLLVAWGVKRMVGTDINPGAMEIFEKAGGAPMSLLSSFIWSVADLLRGDYKQSEYGKVILPFTVLRRWIACWSPPRPPCWPSWPSAPPEGRLNPEPFLLRKSGQLFYNTSPLDMKKLMGDQDHIGENLRAYMQAFSPAVRDIFESFEFPHPDRPLAKAGLLYLVTEKFANIDLHPDSRQQRPDGRGLRGTDPQVRRAFQRDRRRALHPARSHPAHGQPALHRGRRRPDQARRGPLHLRPTAGTGGMLSVAGEHLASLNPDARLVMYGQELNAESYAICKADMLIKGQDIANIIFGNTLSADGLPGKHFDYMLSNPPFGVEWKKIEKEIRKEAEEQGFNGRFGPGLPRVSDGSLLFLLHLISKMRPAKDGGSRFGIVLNGSPLFTGGAGSGESEIRRYVLENDLVEAIIGLPTDMFYNTGISTYVWIVSNRKPAARKGKVQLIDASSFWQKMRKSLGSKRKELSPEHIEDITKLFGDFKKVTKDGVPISRIFKNEDFGYRTITVERPERDAKGKIVLGTKGKGKGQPVPDSNLRDTENVPLSEDVETYFKREVLPHAPDAWIDHEKTKVGYEIPFNRHFYVFKPPRPLAEIDAELKGVTDRILTMIGGLTK